MGIRHRMLYWNMGRHNAVQLLADNLGVAYIDMNVLNQESSIDWVLDTRDQGEHLIYRGVTKATSYISEYLAELQLFNDKR